MTKATKKMSLTSEPWLNKVYLDAVRASPCIACYLTQQSQSQPFSEAHHESLSLQYKSYRRKNDYTAVPLCLEHHLQRHNGHAMDSFWMEVVGTSSAPYYAALLMLQKFSKDQNLLLTEDLYDVMDNSRYLTMEEYDLRKTIDRMSEVVHYRYTTGDNDSEI